MVSPGESPSYTPRNKQISNLFPFHLQDGPPVTLGELTVADRSGKNEEGIKVHGHLP